MEKKKPQRTAHVVLFRQVGGPAAPVGVLVPSFTPGLGWNVFMSLLTCIIKLTFGHHTRVPFQKAKFCVSFSLQNVSRSDTRCLGGLLKPGGLGFVV